jgi:hypothetical protein
MSNDPCATGKIYLLFNLILNIFGAGKKIKKIRKLITINLINAPQKLININKFVASFSVETFLALHPYYIIRCCIVFH